MCLSKAIHGSRTKVVTEDMAKGIHRSQSEQFALEDGMPLREIIRRSSSGDISKPSKEELKSYAKKFGTSPRKFIPERPPKWYLEILKHSQPAHFVVMVTVMWLAWILFPDENRKPADPTTFTSVIYAISFTCHFGSQFWMTFVSGIALFLSISRHTFGLVQQVLFPLYFLINSVLGVITLATYVSHLPTGTWDLNTHVQVFALTTCFLTELLIRLYLVPPLLNLLKVKMAIEKEAGIGKEIGKPKFGNLVHCPHFMQIHKAFRRVHGSIAMGNIIAVACNSIHLYYVATQLCVAVAS